MKRFAILALFLLSFFQPHMCAQSLHPILVHIVSNESETCGVAVYGQAVEAFFEVVLNQWINTSFTIMNTGDILSNISISDKTINPNNSVKVHMDKQPFQLDVDESRNLNLSVVLLSNDTDLVVVQIQITSTPAVVDPTKNIASSSVISKTMFSLSGEVCKLSVYCVDETYLPYAHLKVNVRRAGLRYGTSLTNINGTARFVLAKGNYTVYVYDGNLLMRTKDVALSGNYSITISIERKYIYETHTDPFVNLFFVIVAFISGYLVRYAENLCHRKKKRKAKSEEEELFEWALGGEM